MSSRRGGHRAPALIVEDPGPWGVVSDVQRAMGGMMGGGGVKDVWSFDLRVAIGFERAKGKRIRPDVPLP